MIVDEFMYRFLSEREPLLIHLAVADAYLRPYSLRGFGVRVQKGSDVLRIYIIRTQASKLLASIEGGSKVITGLFTDGRTNESYQLKGTLLSCKPCSDEDGDGVDLQRYREGSLRVFPKLYDQFPLTTTVCSHVSYQVTDIYTQTPGTDAGRPYRNGG